MNNMNIIQKMFRKWMLFHRIKKVEKALGFKLLPKVIDFVFYDKPVEFSERCMGATTAAALKFIFDDTQSNVVSPSVLMYGRYKDYRNWNGQMGVTCILGDASSHNRASYTVSYYRRIYQQLKSAGIKVRQIYFYPR